MPKYCFKSKRIDLLFIRLHKHSQFVSINFIVGAFKHAVCLTGAISAKMTVYLLRSL